MAFVPKNLLRATSPFTTAKRFGAKINIQRPQKLFYERQLVHDLCLPILPKIIRTREANCRNLTRRKRVVIENPYERILANECLNWLNNSNMVAFYHVNPTPGYRRFAVFSELTLNNMHLCIYGKKTVAMAVNGTPFEAIKAMFCGDTQIVFSERVQINEMFRIMKKIPQYILIGGILEGRFISRNEFLEYAKLKTITNAQSKLCQVLDTIGGGLVQTLTRVQSSIVNDLDTYVKIKQTEDTNK